MIKRILITAVLFLSTLLISVQAQMPGTFMPVIGVSAPPKVLTFQGSFAQGGGATITYTNAPIGTASADRYVIVAVAGEDNANTTITSITVGGNTPTTVVTSNNVRSSLAIYIILVPSGTTATISATFSISKDGSWIGVWTATGLTSITAAGTNTQTTNNTAASVTTSDGGFVVGVCGNYGAAATPTWTNLTQRYASTQNGSRNGTGADVSSVSGTSVNVTCNMSAAGNAYGMALAGW